MIIEKRVRRKSTVAGNAMNIAFKRLSISLTIAAIITTWLYRFYTDAAVNELLYAGLLTVLSVGLLSSHFEEKLSEWQRAHDILFSLHLLGAVLVILGLVFDS